MPIIPAMREMEAPKDGAAGQKWQQDPALKTEGLGVKLRWESTCLVWCKTRGFNPNHKKKKKSPCSLKTKKSVISHLRKSGNYLK
jgi:hypothetical protein